jgi:hypothetical protein
VFVSAAVGIGAMALGGVYLYKLDGRNEEARQICPSGNYCTPQEDAAHDELLADARRDRLISFVALGVGVAALAASVALWWRSGQSP